MVVPSLLGSAKHAKNTRKGAGIVTIVFLNEAIMSKLDAN